MFQHKNILLGVCGSIAAYKSAILTRLLIKAGANVQVIMTPAAADFITPLTLSTLSRRPVLSSFTQGNAWNNHVELGLWADFFLIAPASANTIAKMAGGHCDNILLAAWLSARCPVYLAPAMDLDMWKHPGTQKNIATLSGYGNRVIMPEHGELASGLTGTGRMAEPEEIIRFLENDPAIPAASLPLSGKKILVTAGPTYEAIDPVRFIGNHSSGKMGFALASAFARQGAEVELISGPASLEADHERIRRTDVTDAEEMYQACLRLFPDCQAAVMAAAVADYRPASTALQKLKKKEDKIQLHLTKNRDILAELGRIKKPGQVLAGFALETDDELEHAREKLRKKNLDFIVLNSLRDQGAGFKGDTNKVTIIDKQGEQESYPLKTKTEVAADIVKKLVSALGKK